MATLDAYTNSETEKDRAKAILLEIIRQSNGCFNGSTRLYKAFYFAHLYYYRENPDVLSSWPVVHMPEGPGIESGAALISELHSEGLIEIGQRMKGPYTEDVYVLKSASVASPLSPEAIEAVKKSLQFIKGKSAASLSALLHEKSRTWKAGKLGDELNIYLDLMTESEYQEAMDRRNRIEAGLGLARSGGS